MTTGPIVRVQIPASLRRLAGGVAEVPVMATTLREVIAALESQFPGFRERLCDGERLKPGLAMAIDSRIAAGGLGAAVPAGSEVAILHAAAGG